MIRLDGGDFLMGTDGPWAYEGDGEGPVHQVTLDPFWIGATTVTNAAFAAFVDATGHVTDAERYGWSFVFAGLLPDDFEDTRGVAASTLVATGLRRGLAHTRRSAVRTRRPGATIRSIHVSWHDARRTRRGPARACRPKPNGSTQHAADSSGAVPVGRTTSNPTASTA